MTTLTGKIGLVAIGVGIVAPIVTLSLVLLAVEGRVRVSDVPGADGGASSPAADYAQTFSMTIYEEGRTVQLWLADLDTAPYLRQTIDVAGATVSDQIYRFDERTLYTANGESADASWSSVAAVEPASLALADLISGPATWAAQFGAGEQQIPLAQGGTVRVVIHSVGEPIDPSIFRLPPDATVSPAAP